VAALKKQLENARRVVIKIGSALLVDDITGRLRRAWLEARMGGVFLIL